MDRQAPVSHVKLLPTLGSYGLYFSGHGLLIQVRPYDPVRHFTLVVAGYGVMVGLSRGNQHDCLARPPHSSRLSPGDITKQALLAAICGSVGAVMRHGLSPLM